LLSLIVEAGVEVDKDKKIARFPEDLVEESLAKAPSAIRVHSRDGKHDLMLTRRIMKRHGVDTLPLGPSTAISETQAFFYSEGH
jgi:hypothetical protein